VTPSHAPSTRLGACDPCAAGDHAGCTDTEARLPDPGILWPCTCYDDAWEWHETLGHRSTP